jgi:integrase
VLQSKGGEARYVALSDEGVAFLRGVAADRAPGEWLFLRRGLDGDGAPVPWGRSHQFRPLRSASAAAGIAPAASFHVLRHTYASRLAMRGVQMPVIAAQLGHADTRMTERHYAHLAPSYVSEMARNGLGVLGIASPREEMSLTAARGGA